MWWCKVGNQIYFKRFFSRITVCICKCQSASAVNVFSLVSHLLDEKCCTSNTVSENMHAKFETRNWHWGRWNLLYRKVVILTYIQIEVIPYASVPWWTFITIHYLLPGYRMQTFKPMLLDLWGFFSTMDHSVLPDHQPALAEIEGQWLKQLPSLRTDWTQNWLVCIFMQILS